MNTVREIIAAVIILLIGCLLASTMWYRGQYHSAKLEMEVIKEQIKYQNAEAQRQLDALTAQRDQKQAAIDKAYHEQEKKDELAKYEIDRLTAELRDRPVRVRIQCPGGQGGSGSAGNGTTTADHHAGSAATAYGVLPDANSRRLASALNEVEKLSAAYNSCYARINNQPTSDN